MKVLIPILLVVSSLSTAHGQIALELARQGDQVTLLPFIEKGMTLDSLDVESALYQSNRFSPEAKDIYDPLWLEHALQGLEVFSNLELELLFLIPDDNQTVIAVCRMQGRLGYLKLMALRD